MAKKGVDDLSRVDNRTDIETCDAAKEQNLRICKTSRAPKVSKALAESNLVEWGGEIIEQNDDSKHTTICTLPLTSLVKSELPGTLEIAEEICKQQSADKIHTKRMTRVVGINPEC